LGPCIVGFRGSRFWRGQEWVDWDCRKKKGSEQ